jgi:hypothetical protein
MKHSQATKDKISNVQKGKVIPQEQRDKISRSLLGKPKTQEHILNAAKARKAVVVTEEWKENLSKSHIGIVYSEESKIKRSLALKGKPHSELHNVHVRLALADSQVILRRYESRIGGFWYGNVRYYDDLLYCEKFTKEFKERVRAYWNYQCFECGTPQKGRKLGVHHVHYNKKMCCDGSPRDVLPLCQECHSRSNTNRDYWEMHFTELLYAYNPDGKCYFTREEMDKYRTVK